MHSRRALLYMPGDDLRKIRKAATLGVDSACMDMEDGVALNHKKEARFTIIEALNTIEFGKTERLARINPVGSGFEIDDLQSVLPAHPDGIVLPKVESAEQIQWVCNQISQFEQRFGWSNLGIPLLAIVETALGIINIREIACSDERLEGLIFGSEDFAGDIGAIRTREGWEVFHARSSVITHAAAFNLQAIDMVYIDFQDNEGLRQEALQGAQMGFSGKQIIHPNQVNLVQEAFTPSDDSIEFARQVIELFEQNQTTGTGAFALNGKMIDMPIVKAAERVLLRARAAGKI